MIIRKDCIALNFTSYSMLCGQQWAISKLTEYTCYREVRRSFKLTLYTSHILGIRSATEEYRFE